MTASWNQAFAPKCTTQGAVLVGLLGTGVSASRTPRMHMAEGAAQGVPFEYRLIDADTAATTPDIPEVLSRLEDAGFDGINVTFPFKQAVMPYLSSLSDGAQSVGAVNTVLFRDGARRGDNTDLWGFRESMRRGLPSVRRDTVLLLGAGGAGGAVAQALIDEGAGRVLVQDTDRAKAENLVERLGAGRGVVVTDLAAAAASADGVVNATPVGMDKLPGLPLPEALIERRHWIADIVYFPLETALLALARRRGCAVLPGSGMALYQAVRAFELFTGRRPDPERMWSAFTAVG
ncbi:shikimate dehydrogenase [Puniceibacterium sediminis]|nr:shikimate dehydrogenase [Puniceibacterium sediminis]